MIILQSSWLIWPVVKVQIRLYRRAKCSTFLITCYTNLSLYSGFFTMQNLIPTLASWRKNRKWLYKIFQQICTLPVVGLEPSKKAKQQLQLDSNHGEQSRDSQSPCHRGIMAIFVNMLRMQNKTEGSYPCTWQFMLTCVLLPTLSILTKIAGIIYIH